MHGNSWRDLLLQLSQYLEFILCVAFALIGTLMLWLHHYHLGLFYTLLAALLSPFPFSRNLSPVIKLWVIIIGVFL
ncbi:hypothetical protein [Phormidesmis priestleyi]